MIKVIILGGHGDGDVVGSAIDFLKEAGHDITLHGFLNDFEEVGSTIYGAPVLDKIMNAKKFLSDKDVFFFSTLLKAQESYARVKLIEAPKIPIDRFTTIIHPHATVARNVNIGNGTFVGSHVTIMPNVSIGNHCSFRASANIGHDVKINNYCYFGPNTTLIGHSVYEEGAHVAANAVINRGLRIGTHSLIGFGSIVMEDIPEFSIAFGAPAKVKSKVKKT